MNFTLFIYMPLLILSFLVVIEFYVVANSNIPVASLPQPKAVCHDHEKLALLRFKQSFVVDCHTSSAFAYPKMNSWDESDNSGDCCRWDGVKCKEQTGHVIGVDLSSSCLSGNYPSNSSLFSLDHLLELNLADNYFNYTPIPSDIGRLSKLTSLNLSESAFSGLVPPEISKLSALSILDLSLNDNLHVINFDKLVSDFPHLTQLHLDQVVIPPVIPLTLGNLSSLKAISLRNCSLIGKFPTSLLQLPNLEKVSLDFNLGLRGHLPEFQSSSPLRHLSVSDTAFSGGLPTSIGNLSSLNVLNLSSCKFSGSIPPSLGNLNKLTYLTLDGNRFRGNLPYSMENLTQLSTLFLSDVLDVGPGILNSWLLKQNKLTQLSLINMSLSGSEILQVVANLTKLTHLVLRENHLSGHLSPHWLTSLTHLTTLDLSSNMLRGRLPFPSCSMQEYLVSNNLFSGNIPEQFCCATSLSLLDLSYNTLGGKIPRCFGDSLGDSLQLLRLGYNSFGGNIPDTFSRSCQLKMIHLNQNQLEGKLPQSLVNCTMLEVLDVGRNRINDTFPSWLGSLPKLLVLMLAYNFHGRIDTAAVGHKFHCLALLDLSSNFYMGEFPADFLKSLLGMKLSSHDLSDPSNMNARIYLSFCSASLVTKNEKYDYGHGSISLEDLGLYSTLKGLDFSGNKFTGRIPEFIGDAVGLLFLNLSNNLHVGCIPSSFGNLAQLESLDLSRNKLSGEIPQELTQLNNLALFNVSYNHLVGPVPNGNNFDTFDKSSYQGNVALCGRPLSDGPCAPVANNSCQDIPSLPSSSPTDEEDDKSGYWIVISFGCVSGFTIGFVLGKIYITDSHHDWFIEKFGKKARARRSARRRSRNN